MFILPETFAYFSSKQSFETDFDSKVILTILIASWLNQKYTHCNESIFKQEFTEI